MRVGVSILDKKRVNYRNGAQEKTKHAAFGAAEEYYVVSV